MFIAFVSLLMITTMMSYLDASSIILQSSSNNKHLNSFNNGASQEENKKYPTDATPTRLELIENVIDSLTKENHLLKKQVESQNKDISLLKNQNENQTQEIIQVKSLIQNMLDLYQQSECYSNREVVDSSDISRLSKKRSARSTIGEPTPIGKRTNATTITTPKPKLMFSDVVRELKKTVSGMNATHSSSLKNLDVEMKSLKEKLNSIEPVVVKLNEDIKELEHVKRKMSDLKSPPSSCQELSMMGHYLNGLYAIKNKWARKVQTVYCQFESSSVGQELVGTVDVKTVSVHFYVQRNSKFMEDAVIPFELERLNEGGAFDLDSGFFTAPVPGIYHFEFSGIKDSSGISLYIYLQVNRVNVGLAYAYDELLSDNVVLSASLRLAANDRVNLYHWNEDGGVLLDTTSHLTHFSGWLVEEDLI